MFPQQAALDSEDLSRKYFERALRVSPGGVHSPVRAFKGVGGTPIFFRSAQGAKLTSVDGREYIDFCQSFGPLMLGHRDPDVSEAVQEAIETAWSFARVSRIRSSWRSGLLHDCLGLRCCGSSLPARRR